MLGERIRELRKKKKMTLEALAGDELTKGMLSLIENNKANPSMESLAYIAKQLDAEISDLLEEVSSQELREVLEKAEKIYNVHYESEENRDKYKMLLELIEPYLDKLSEGYESARLLDLYSRSLYHEKKEGYLEYSNRAIEMYDEMNLTLNRVNIAISRSKELFVEHHYSRALDIFLKERRQIEEKHVYIDPMARLDLDYNEAIFYFAVGNFESATVTMEKAIKFSKEHRIFYRINDLFRLAAAYALETGEEDKMEYYLLKLKQYGEFAEDVNSHFFCEVFSVMSLINKQNYQMAMKLIENNLSHPNLTDIDKFDFILQKGKVFYGLNRFNEALECFKEVKIPPWMHHPFDLSLYYIADIYNALCYLELGNHDQAREFAAIAVENFKPLPNSRYKEFANDTYSKIIAQFN